MNQKTLPLTQGAMMIAIFGALLLLNRQTGGLLNEFFLIAMPIPMAAYALRYGWRKGFPVFVGMCLISFFFGTFYTIFYAASQSLVGLVFGGMLHRKADMTTTLFLVMALSGFFSALNLVLDLMLFGYDLTGEVTEMQNMMMEAIANYAPELVPAMEQTLSTNYFRQIFLVSTVFWGLVEGYIVFQVGLVVMKRLHFPVERPKSIYQYYPPKPLGYLAVALFLSYGFTAAQPLPNPMQQNVVQILGICGYLYLVCFGVIGLTLLLKRYAPGLRGFRVVLAVLLVFLFPQLVLVFGFLYGGTDWHRRQMEALEEN